MCTYHVRLLMILIPSLLMISKNSQAANNTLNPQEEQAIHNKFINASKESGAILFTPPEGWVVADSKALPPHAQVMVIGKDLSVFPPSINLTTEKFSGTLKDYIKIIKSINESKGSEWKDLGNIPTAAGLASLSQAEIKTEYGNVKMMHVVLLKDEMIYILTGAALRDEFPKFYKDFFKSFQSIRFNT